MKHTHKHHRTGGRKHHCHRHHRVRARAHPSSGTPLKVIIPNRVAVNVEEKGYQKAPVNVTKSESKGNVPLQPVENTIVSQRQTSAEENQVGNYATVCDPCCTPQVQQVCYEDSCCVPSACTTTCVSERELSR